MDDPVVIELTETMRAAEDARVTFDTMRAALAGTPSGNLAATLCVMNARLLRASREALRRIKEMRAEACASLAQARRWKGHAEKQTAEIHELRHALRIESDRGETTRRELEIVRTSHDFLVGDIDELVSERDAARDDVARAVAAEREACASLCEDAAGAEASMGVDDGAAGDTEHEHAHHARASALRQAAQAIRARGAGGAP